MKLAYSKPTRTQEDNRVLFQRFAEYGFEGLQLKPNQYRDSLSDAEGFSRQPGVASGLIIFNPPEDGGDQLRKTIDFASTVGGERVIFCHGIGRGDQSEAGMRAYARTLGDYAKRATERGIAFSLHHHTDDPVMTAEDVRHFYAAEEAGGIGLTIDTGHLAKSGINDIPGFIREFHAQIDNVHLKDFDGQDWVLPGRGSLDLGAILQALDEVGYTGWLCLDEESPTPLLESLGACAEWIRSNYAHQPERK